MKIKCGLCGSYYKLKKSLDVDYWVCRKHDIHSKGCPSKRISEESITNAFISLFNKLYLGCFELLVPIKQALQELEVKRAVGNNSIIELRRDILQLKVFKRIQIKTYFGYLYIVHLKCCAYIQKT